MWLVTVILIASCASTATDVGSTRPAPAQLTIGPTAATTSSTLGAVDMPPATSLAVPNQDARWIRRGVGMSDATLASSGNIVLADDRVYVADGFGAGRDGEHRRVSALDALSGEVVWQRDDLTGEQSVDDVFLQALVGDTLVVNGQYDTVTAVASSTGDTIWSFRLPEGYGAVRSAVSEDVLLVGTEAPREGDVRPPIVYALDVANGSTLWSATLAEGTDLQWHSPPLADGLVFVSSTLSHPGSASGNMIHAVDVSTGELRWVAELGGDQLFHFYPALVIGELLVSWSPEGAAIAHRVSDGSMAWARAGVIPMAVDASGSVYGYADGIVELDLSDGLPTPIAGSDAVGVVADAATVRDDDLIILTGRLGASGVDLRTGDQVWRLDTPVVVAPAAVTSNSIVLPIDSGVAVFDIP